MYDELPIAPDYPPGSAWGLFGVDDQIGTLNRCTAAHVLSAAHEVVTGKVFALNWPLELPDPPILDRAPLRHVINRGSWWTDDYYDNFYPQASSQWDALCHIAHPEFGFYNGVQHSQVTGGPGSRNGIDHWARRGIVGRWVLADVARYRESIDKPLDPSTSTAIETSEIDSVLRWHNVELRDGDILLLRFGWLAWYLTASEATRQELSRLSDAVCAAGLSHAEATAAWLWDRGVAAVACDAPGLEVLPYEENPDGCLHMRLIPLLGMAVGEFFDLEALAAECAVDQNYSGLFASAPLNKTGGSGSTANALAIK